MKHALLAGIGAVCLAIGCTGEMGGGGPTAPSDLTAGPMGGGVHLTWTDNSADEDGFDIERKIDVGNAGFAMLDSVPFDTSLYHDSAVAEGTTYVYRIRATRATSYSAYSNEASADPGGGGAGTTGSGGAGGTAAGDGGTGGGASGTTGGAGTTGSAGTTGRGGTTGSAGTMGRGGTTGSAGTTGRGGTTGSAGTTGRGGAGGGTGGTTAAVVSFRRDVVPSIVQSCGSTTVGCHNNDQAVGRIMPQFGPCKVIWFSAVDGPVGAKFFTGPNAGQATGCPDLGLYDRLLQLHSMLCDGSTWSARASYVVPGDLQRSLLYQVIAGDATMGGKCTANGVPVARMPKVDPTVLPNGRALTTDEIQKIADWIMQGAPNN